MSAAPNVLKMMAANRWTPFVAVAVADEPVLDEVPCRMLDAEFVLLALFELDDVEEAPIPGDLVAIAAQADLLAVRPDPTFCPRLATIA